jgi:hypothetical protein
MKRATMSFDQKRKAVSRAAAEESKGGAVTKRVSFPNNDVPGFLQELRRFQEDSRAKRILAR